MSAKYTFCKATYAETREETTSRIGNRQEIMSVSIQTSTDKSQSTASAADATGSSAPELDESSGSAVPSPDEPMRRSATRSVFKDAEHEGLPDTSPASEEPEYLLADSKVPENDTSAEETRSEAMSAFLSHSDEEQLEENQTGSDRKGMSAPRRAASNDMELISQSIATSHEKRFTRMYGRKNDWRDCC